MSPARPSLAGAAALAALLAAAPAHAQAHDHQAMMGAASDSAAVVQAVEAYHAALRGGDAEAALALLADDVRIAESGGLETREEYRSHHLPGDMAFAGAVKRVPGTIHVTVLGDVAWAVSSSRTTGTFRERAIDSNGAELMVLTRHDGAWRIRAIHWSSRQAR